MQLFVPPSSTLWQSNFSATPSSAGGQTITASATINTKGAWSQIVASTTHDVYGFWLMITSSATAATNTNTLLDIGIGAAASEIVLLPDWMVGYRDTGSTWGGGGQFIPLYIPKGTRVSARSASVVASKTCAVCIVFNEASTIGMPIFSDCDAYGVTSASSSGTAHTAGNTGAFSVAASVGTTTSRTYGAIHAMVTPTIASPTGSVYYHWDCQIGGTTMAQWRSGTAGSSVSVGTFPPSPFYKQIPSGVQLQVRGTASGTAESHSIIYYCFG